MHVTREMIDLRTLRQFVCVAETESIAKAAERLHISASPLSRTIIQLERQVGFALFERVGRGLRLNGAGRELLQNARDLLVSNERLALDLQRRAQGESGTVVIGHMPGALYNGILPAAVKRVQAANPAIKFQFEGTLEERQLGELQHGRLDFSVQTKEVSDPGLSSALFAREDYVLLLPRHHAMARLKSIKLEHLVSADWVVTPERAGPSLRTRFTAACARLGFAPRVACVAGDIISALALVANDFGLCVAQESLVQFAGANIAVRKLPLMAMQTEYRIVWRPDALSLSAAKFLEELTAKPALKKKRRALLPPIP